MSKININFTGNCMVFHMGTPSIVLTMDEEGNKKATLYYPDSLPKDIIDKSEVNNDPPMRLMRAFTKSAVEKILSKDEIPNDSDFCVIDGYSYDITITKDEITKVYSADDASINTYPLLKYLASWFRRLDR